MAGLTNSDFERIRCAHCGKRFSTYFKGADKDGPDDVPWVNGGLISIQDESGEELYYHGYFHDRSCCYYQSNPDG